MEPKMRILITLFLSVVLNSCRPDHNAFILNNTEAEVLIESRGGVTKVSSNGETPFDEIKDLDRLILTVSGHKIELGNILRQLSLAYLQASSVEVSEPYHLLVVVKNDGFIYLGYRTVAEGRSGLFGRQPDRFPYKWK